MGEPALPTAPARMPELIPAAPFVCQPVCPPVAAEEELSPSDFLMSRYKLHWCPIQGFHDWRECCFAHNYQDARRDPRIGYVPQLCPEWKESDRGLPYHLRCSRGLACPFAHGAKEQLYHPKFFRTVKCADWAKGGGVCPRGDACAFYHAAADRRQGSEVRPKLTGSGDKNTRRIAQQVLDEFLQPDFEQPPFGSREGPQGKWGWCEPEAVAVTNDALLLQYDSLFWASIFPDGYPNPFNVEVQDEPAPPAAAAVAQAATSAATRKARKKSKVGAKPKKGSLPPPPLIDEAKRASLAS